MPEVTVLMLVKNGEKYVRDAIDSVLKQSFNNFEFLIIDDGSTDKTASIIKSYTDPRIQMIKQKPNFIKALNKGLSLAKGEFIARMDADDIMHTERLRIQLKRMKLHPDIVVCGSWAKSFKDDGSQIPPLQFGEGYIEHPILQMLRGNILVHSSVMIKKSFMNNHKLKYQQYPLSEDYKLWFEIAKAGGKFFIEPQYLLNFRVSDTQITNVKKDSMMQQTIIIKKEILKYLLKIEDNKTFVKLFKTMEILEKENIILSDNIFQFFWNILIPKNGN